MSKNKVYDYNYKVSEPDYKRIQYTEPTQAERYDMQRFDVQRPNMTVSELPRPVASEMTPEEEELYRVKYLKYKIKYHNLKKNK